MIRKDSSFVNKALCFLILVTMSGMLMAQKKPAKNPLESFLDTQFWLGIKMGVNVTQANPETRNTGFSPIDYNADSLQKSYDDFSLPGAHVGLEMNFYHRGFSVSFQPAYKRSRFKYNSALVWRGETSGTRRRDAGECRRDKDLVDEFVIHD